MDPTPPAGAEARLFLLARRVIALVWDAPELVPGERVRLRVDGAIQPPPIVVTAMPLAGQGVRRMVSIAAPPGRLPQLEATDRDGRPIAVASAGLTVASDPRDIMAGLSAEGRQRFVGFVLNIAPGLFGLTADQSWLRLCEEVCADAVTRPARLRPRCLLPGGYWLVEATVDAASILPGDATVLTRNGLRRLGVGAIRSGGPTTWLALGALPERIDREVPISLPASGGARLAVLSGAGGALPSLSSWLQGAGKPLRAVALDVLARLAARTEVAGALLRELRAAERGGAPAKGRVDLGFVVAGKAFVFGRLADPARVVDRVVVEAAGERVTAEVLHRWQDGNGSVERFAAVVPAAAGAPLGTPVRVLAELGSGRLVTFGSAPAVLEVAAARKALLELAAGSALPEDVLRDVLRGALAALAEADPVRVAHAQIGSPQAAAAVTVVLAAGHDPDVLRCQIAAVATSRPPVPVDLAVVVEDPDREAALQAHLRGLVAIYGLPTRLIGLRGGYGRGPVLAALLGEATSRLVVRLGDGVVPQGRAWLQELLQPLRDDPECAVASATLLTFDGVVEDAGATVARDGSGRFRRCGCGAGLPAAFLGEPTVDVPSAAAFAVDLGRIAGLADLLPGVLTDRGVATALALAARHAGRGVRASTARFTAIGASSTLDACSALDAAWLEERWTEVTAAAPARSATPRRAPRTRARRAA